MIHYMTTQGVGDAWVGNELRVVTKAGIPVRLHALNRPQSTYFTALIEALNRATNVIYPLLPVRALLAGAGRCKCSE